MYKLLYLMLSATAWGLFQRWYTAGMFRGAAIVKINRILPLYLAVCALEYYCLFG